MGGRCGSWLGRLSKDRNVSTKNVILYLRSFVAYPAGK